MEGVISQERWKETQKSKRHTPIASLINSYKVYIGERAQTLKVKEEISFPVRISLEILEESHLATS